MPAVLLQNDPCQVTDLMPPGRPLGTDNGAPDTKMSPVPPVGTLVSQSLSLGSNVVDADVAAGSKTMTALGTATLYEVPPAVKPIVSFSTWTVTGPDPLGMPLTVSALLNQRELPAGIAVPLKFAVIEDTVDGTRRSSNSSSL